MGSRLGARRALISLVVFGALAGCGDDSAVEVTATPVPTVSSATPEPSPTPTAPATAVPLPVMPPEMANNDAAGAEAAVRYFVALADYALATGDVSQWAAVTDDDCVFCQSIEESAQEISSQGWVRSGGGLEIEVMGEPQTTQVPEFFLVVATVDEKQYEYLDRTGASVEQSDGSAGEVTFGVQFADGQWILIAAGDPEAAQTS